MAKNGKGVEMSYADSQKKWCQLVPGMDVVLTRAWSKGERGFGFGWNITWARYIGRRLRLVEITEHGVCVNPRTGGALVVPWFVLEPFHGFKPVSSEAVANGNEPKKDRIESIAEGTALKVANYSGVVTRVPNSTEVVYPPNESNLADKMQALASDIRDATSGKSFVSGTLKQIANNLGLNDPPKKLPSMIAIWKDGAVCRPTKYHADSDGLICLFSKKTGGLDWAGVEFENYEEHFWLDMAPQTRLTPKELLDVYRVIYPDANEVVKTAAGWDARIGNRKVEIDWSESTRYPDERKWRTATDADKGRKCRAWDAEKRSWTEATFVSTWEDVFIVKGGYWPFPIEVQKCEVLDDEPN